MAVDRTARTLVAAPSNVLSVTLLLGTVLTLQDAAWPQGAGAQWTTPAGTVQGTRFSSLAQINTTNVGELKKEFRFATGVRAGHQGQPLVVGSTMYIVTPFPNRLFALDLDHPGQTRWVFDPDPDEFAIGQACCGIVNRGPVYANGKVIYNALDTTTIAVDAVTGRRVWRTKLGKPHAGETMTMAPLRVGNKVFVGVSGAELGARGFVAALDVTTGRELWRAWSTGPDADVLIGSRFKPFYPKDKGKDLGVTSWPGTLWKQGGGTVWNWLTYDPQLNLLFYGTANAAPWNPDMRPGDNKWSATIFARDPDTGEAIWAYQVTPHDSWDYDAISENIAVDLPFQGTTRKLLVHFDKNGFAYTLDRATGQVLTARKFVPANWATGINLGSGLPDVNHLKVTREGVLVKDICPSPLGGKEHTPAAFSPITSLFYVPAINICVDYEALRVNFIRGTPFLGAAITLKPGPSATGSQSEFIAWDAVSGRRVWRILEPLPLFGGALATAGNLVFYGTMDGWFKAVDAKTGEVLFKTKLAAGVVGNPMAYLGPDGKQRIAIYSGRGGSAFAGDDDSSEEEDGGGGGVTVPVGAVHVFKLP